MKTFVIKTKEEWEMDVEYYVEAETEEEALRTFKDEDNYTSVDENFAATLDQKIIKIEEDK